MNPFTRLVQAAARAIRGVRPTVGGIAKMVARKIGSAISQMGGTLSDLGSAIDSVASGSPLDSQRSEAAFSHLIKTREKLFARLDPMEDVPTKLIIYRPLNENYQRLVTWQVEKFFPETGARITTYMSYYFDSDMVPEDYYEEMLAMLQEDPRYDMPFEIHKHSLALVQQNVAWTPTT